MGSESFLMGYLRKEETEMAVELEEFSKKLNKLECRVVGLTG